VFKLPCHNSSGFLSASEVEARVQSRISPYEMICKGQCGIGSEISQSPSVFLCKRRSTNAHSHFHIHIALA
jgi:hypothetical protein